MIKVYTMYDKQSASYGTPMFARSDHEMVVVVVEFIAGNMAPRWKDHPADFILYSIGEFDQATGMFHNRPMVPVGEVANMTTVRQRFEESAGQLELEDFANG